MTTRVVVTLTGPEAQLGRVRATDVARLLTGFERTVARAAAGIAGRRPGLAGRRGGVVENATRLVLDAIEEGSVAAILELPPTDAEPGTELELDDMTLGTAALEETLDTLTSGTGSSDVADALAGLAEELDIGGRFTSLTVERSTNGRTRAATLDRRQRQRLRELAGREDTHRSDSLYGVLFEANFERRTAQLRLPSGHAVTVSFSEELEDAVYEALRERSQLEGIVRYDVATAEATSVELRSVMRVEQRELELMGNVFWHERTVEELASEQGIEPLTDPALIRDEDASEEEVAAFFDALRD